MDLKVARHRSEGGAAGVSEGKDIKLFLEAHKNLIYMSLYVPFCRRWYLV